MKKRSGLVNLVVFAAFLFLFGGESFHVHANPQQKTNCAVCQSICHTPLSGLSVSIQATPIQIAVEARPTVVLAFARVTEENDTGNRGPPTL